jgi:hypothetical protein
LSCVNFERFVLAVHKNIGDEIAGLDEEHLYPDPREPKHSRVKVAEEHEMIADNKENPEAADAV